MEPEKISVRAASALYTGIAHDTGVFQYNAVSPDTMRVAAMLMEKGIEHTRLLDETFYKKTYRQNQILGKALLETAEGLSVSYAEKNWCSSVWNPWIWRASSVS